jgi:DNA/RNA-binding domain of Phe-tRNA-synthetase-like protein
MLGGLAVHLRERPIPWAYRVFFRHIGLDPDQTRTPVEALALKRMTEGGFRSRNRLDDAITIATVETGVALLAFDRDAFSGPLGIRLSAPGEALDGQAGSLPAGTLVIADQDRPLAILFGKLGEGRGVEPGTKSIAIAAVGVKGVPRIAIEEALWTASAVLGFG